MKNRLAFLLVSAVLATSASARQTEPGVALDFIPPSAGSYQLQTIMPAPDGEVLDTSGRTQARKLRLTPRMRHDVKSVRPRSRVLEA